MSGSAAEHCRTALYEPAQKRRLTGRRSWASFRAIPLIACGISAAYRPAPVKLLRRHYLFALRAPVVTAPAVSGRPHPASGEGRPPRPSQGPQRLLGALAGRSRPPPRPRPCRCAAAGLPPHIVRHGRAVAGPLPHYGALWERVRSGAVPATRQRARLWPLIHGGLRRASLVFVVLVRAYLSDARSGSAMLPLSAPLPPACIKGRAET